MPVNLKADDGGPGVKLPFALAGQSFNNGCRRGKERIASRTCDVRRHCGQEHLPQRGVEPQSGCLGVHLDNFDHVNPVRQGCA